MKTTSLLRNNIGRAAALIVLICLATIAAVPAASAAEGWKVTFDEICGKVQGADSLSNQELAAMIEKADRIGPEIQKSDDPAKKVYLQRLKKCRSMYEFMIESKKESSK